MLGIWQRSTAHRNSAGVFRSYYISMQTIPDECLFFVQLLKVQKFYAQKIRHILPQHETMLSSSFPSASCFTFVLLSGLGDLTTSQFVIAKVFRTVVDDDRLNVKMIIRDSGSFGLICLVLAGAAFVCHQQSHIA